MFGQRWKQACDITLLRFITVLSGIFPYIDRIWEYPILFHGILPSPTEHCYGCE